MQLRMGGRLGRAVLVLAGIIAAGPVLADPIPGDVLIYSNFGAGGSFDTTRGWGVGPDPFHLVDQVVGQSFTTTSSLQFADAQLAMFSVGGTSAAVYLESDDGGHPGAILDTLVEQNPIGAPGIVTFDCSLCLTLSAGTRYWIVAAEGDATSAWNWNSIGDDSGIAFNSAGSATGPWNFVPGATRGAFEVDGFTPVPEPGSLTLLSALLGMLGFAAFSKTARTRRDLGNL